MVIEELVKTVLSELREISKTETVVGRPLKVGEMTILPVSRISVGFGAGGGKRDGKDGKGEGTGGGVSVEPVAFIVVRGEKVDLITLKKEEVGWGKVIDLVPQIVEKMRGYREKKGKSSQKEEKARK